MTREEAITYINVIWNRYKAEYEIERETLDAYHMAIETLQTDAVSRINYTPKPCEYANCDCVDVVRCKDCKWWQDSEVGVVECPICTRIHDMVFEMGVYDYCSYGERREE